MIDSQRLRAALHLDEVDPEDLVEVLNWHFGGARNEQPREIGFPQSGDAVLTLRFSKDMRSCDQVVAGPGLDEKTVGEVEEKVRSELLSSTEDQVGVAVLFSLEQVTGVWRYKDRLQLSPVPPEAPRPAFSYADHPSLLEFTYAASNQPMLNGRRKQRAATRWARRLNVLVEPGLEMLDLRARHRWVLVPQDDGKMRSAFLQEGYWLPEGMTFDPKVMSLPEYPPIERVEPSQYYSRFGTQLDALKLPTTLDQLITVIEELPTDALLRFDRAAYWFDYATNVAVGYSSSAAAVALGATIEALFEPESSPEICPECKRALRGPTARFVEFMMEHLAGPDAEGRRRLFAKETAS